MRTCMAFHLPVFFGAAADAAVDVGVAGITPGAENGAPGLVVVVEGRGNLPGNPAIHK